MLRIIHTPTREDTCHQTQQYLKDMFVRYMNKSVLILLSGGSARDVLEGMLASDFPQRTTIAMLDERFSTSPDENNYHLFARTSVYKSLSQSGIPVIDTSVQTGDSLTTFAERYNDALVKWKADNPHGSILGYFGVGPDGHISGIMPYPEDEQKFNALFRVSGKTVVGYDAGDKNPYPLRATTTIPFLTSCSSSVTYVSGPDKADAVHKILASHDRIHEVPGRLLHHLPDSVLITDSLQE